MDFISEIKKISTHELIYAFSAKSIDMFRNTECVKDIEIPATRFQKHGILTVALTAWDILDIEYLSVKYSNDYRYADRVCPPEVLVDLYRDYENQHSVARKMENADSNGMFRILLGMTAEQFKYQNLSWVFEKFNRDYYILFLSARPEHKKLIDTDSIVQEVFGLSAKEYIAVIVMLYWLCMQHPDPLTAPERLYRKKEDTVLTRENLVKVIDYYSCTYEELRTSPLGKQLLYSKPFILTQRYHRYLASSAFLVAMILANGLYWLIRDYYRRQNSQLFVNQFGLLFEDYIKDLANMYCKNDEWYELPQGRQKGADFVFVLGQFQMIVEAKTSLLQLNAMQQVPDMGGLDKYFRNTISESYEQLQSSYEQFGISSFPTAKVILLYDEFSNTNMIELSIGEIFEKDLNCFVMTIREFEVLLYLHKNDVNKRNKIIECIVEQMKGNMSRKSFGMIYQELEIPRDPHFQGDKDILAMLLKNFRKDYF